MTGPALPPRIGGLFEGYGGLSAAVQAVLGGELAWVSEFEPPSKANPRPTQAAARLLQHRHPDVPNLGDVTAIDWAAVPAVDVLCGGFPCQDVSSAGKRVGMRPDSRSGLWTHFARAIAVLQPSIVLIENVRGLLSAEAECDVERCPMCLGDGHGRPLRALGAVLGDLAALGFDAEWTSVLASDVDAPHERWRVFVLAWPAGSDPAELGRRPEGWNDWLRTPGLESRAPDAYGEGREGGRPEGGAESHRRRRLLTRSSDDRRSDVADPDGEGLARAEPAARPVVSSRRPSADAECDGRTGRGTSAPRGTNPRREGPRSTAEGCGADSAADSGRGEHAEVSPGSDALVGERPTIGRGSVELARPGRGPDPARRGDAAEPASHRGVVAGGAGDGRAAATDSDRDGLAERSERDQRSQDRQPAPRGLDTAGRLLEWGDYASAIRRWERVLGRAAPAPTQPGAGYLKMVARRRAGKDKRPAGHRGSLRPSSQLSPRFVEWMMGLDEGWVTDVPGLTRNEQLKLLGNGVVPHQAARALAILLAQAAAPAVAS